MSTLDSSSTLAEIKAAYADNASYLEDASTTKARAFVTAVRLLLLKLPKRAATGGRGGDEIELDPRVLQSELKSAQQYLAANTTGGSILHTSLEDFRS